MSDFKCKNSTEMSLWRDVVCQLICPPTPVLKELGGETIAALGTSSNHPKFVYPDISEDVDRAAEYADKVVLAFRKRLKD